MSALAEAPIATVLDEPAGRSNVVHFRLVDVAAVAMVFAVSATVFATHITRPFPWTDEAATTVVVGRRNWQQIMVLWQGMDAPHVPYYLLAKAWLEVWSWLGLGPLVTIRLLSVVAMAAAVVCVYGLVRREVGITPALLAAAFLVVLPGVSRQAQDARPYAVLTLAVAASWLAWSWWRAASPGRRRGPAVVWGATVAGAALLSPFGLLAGAGQLVAHCCLSWGRGRVDWRAPLVVLIPAGLIAAPQLLVTIGLGRGTEQAVPLTADSLSQTAATVLSDTPDFSSVVPVLVLAGVAVAALTDPALRARYRRLVAVAAVWLAVTVGGGIGVAILRPQLLLARYWTPLTAPVAVLAGVGLAAVVTLLRRAMLPRRRRSAAIIAVVLAASTIGTQLWLGLPAQRSLRTSGGHLALAGAIKAAAQFHRDHPGAPILITSASRQAVFVVTRPDLAAQNPLYVIDDNSTSAWPIRRDGYLVAAELAGQPLVLWLSPPRTDAAMARLPEALVAHGVTVLYRGSIQSWDIARLAID